MAWLWIGAYIAVALLTARATCTRWYRSDPGHYDDMSAWGALGLGLFWPASLPAALALAWVRRPAERLEARKKQLLADRAVWIERWQKAGNAEETETAKAIVGTLEDLLKTGGWWGR